jgi:hypothetical protein
MKQKFRQIVVDGIAYCWRYDPGYARRSSADDPGDGIWYCQDTFTAYLASQRTSPLRIVFRTREDAILGGPLRTGVPINLNNPQGSKINLHTPAMAAQLIQHARQHGWDPEQSRPPFVIEDGLDALAQLGYTIT